MSNSISQGRKSPLSTFPNNNIKSHELFSWFLLNADLDIEEFPDFRMKDNLFTI